MTVNSTIIRFHHPTGFSKKFYRLHFPFSFLLIVSCQLKYNRDALKTWEGQYHYSEMPIRAGAGYNMVMEWKLIISNEGEHYKANLEINGQQTSLKIQGKVHGNEKKITLVYDKELEGINENLKKGDTLFHLVRNNGKIITTWAALEPRLSEDPSAECECFRKE